MRIENPNIKIDPVKLIKIFEAELKVRNGTMPREDKHSLMTHVIMETIETLGKQFETEFAFILRSIFDSLNDDGEIHIE